MRTDVSVTGGDPGGSEPSRECPTAAQLVELLQTAYPLNWEQLLPKRLGALGVAEVNELTSSKLTKFRDQVFWSAKQAGFKDPAAWISHRAHLQPKAAPSPTLRPPVQGGDTEGQSKSGEREPVPLENSPATPSPASALPPVPPNVLCESTKTEALSRAKAAVETGASLRDTAKRLACEQQDFHASQREIGRAIGRSASWVNRLLKWRQSGYKQRSPFGPTTRADRNAHRKSGNKDLGEHRGAKPPKDDGNVKSAGHSPSAYQTASVTPPESLLSASAQSEVRPDGDAVMRETDGVKEDTSQVGSRGQPPEKQKLPARNAKIGRKLSLERMRSVIEALKKYPFFASAAAVAGIHRRTLEYWLKGSKAGRNGYDIECEGIQWRFHELCEAAVEEAHQRLKDRAYDIALGPVTYKIDRDLLDLGNQGADAYARNEAGGFIEESRGPGNVKMQKHLLQWLRPEKWGKTRKSRTLASCGVLIIDRDRPRPKNNCSASIKARQWKSASRRFGLPRPQES
jgi:hypothetical protein